MFFWWTLVHFFREHGSLSHTNFFMPHNSSQHKDIDSICEEAWQLHCPKTNPWIHHACGVKGCQEGIVTIFYPL